LKKSVWYLDYIWRRKGNYNGVFCFQFSLNTYRGIERVEKKNHNLFL